MKSKDSVLVNIAKIIVLLLGILSIIHNVGLVTEHPRTIVDIVVVCLAVYYMFVDYKVPHSNLLKILFIVHVAEMILDFWLYTSKHAKALDISDLLLFVTIAIISYVAGRLDRYKENIVLLSVAALLSFVSGILGLNAFAVKITSPLSLMGVFSKFIILLSLIIPYVSRYKAHKAAGLEDKAND